VPKDPSSVTKDLTRSFNDLEQEVKNLRFARHISAFDVDIDVLDEKPWRNKNIDLLDYFNYGFNERTWRVSELCFAFFYYFVQY
jgi:hypothetical protein